MGLQSDFTLYIDGDQITSIADFKLQEQVGNHAFFVIKIRTDVLEQSSEQDHVLGDSRRYLGKELLIQLSAINNDQEHTFEFKGIIKKMNPQLGFHGAGDDITEFIGYSTTIILDDGPRYRSFTEMPLTSIIQEAIGTYDQSKLTVAIAPENDATLHYSVTYGETPYAYLKRLAISRGEYLVYNKDTLYFGKPDLGNEVSLSYGVDLKNFTIGVTPKPGKTAYLGYNYHTEEHLSSATSDVATQVQGATAFASNVANNLYHQQAQALQPAYEHTDLMHRMDALVALQKQVTQQQQVVIQGSSNNLGVALGKVIHIQSDAGNYGSYRVTQVSHDISGMGTYQNQFEAVPMDLDVFPLTDITTSCKAHSQMATIIDTNDPQGMSRVQIRYPFDDSTGVNSPWIRMATPYAGNGYGLHAIPEIGTPVLIQYYMGNIEQPYVANTFYTGVNKHTAWQSENNEYKGIVSKSGHTIELKDTQGGEMISITDKENNRIELNTVTKSIHISAPENLVFTAKNIQITAEENITIGAQQNVEIAAEGDINTIAQGNIALQSTGDTTARSSGAIALEATSDLTAIGQNTILEGRTAAELNGMQTKVNGSTLAEITSTIVKLN
jgi:uncharacterized protein involved in type VI secretion and phage assembly